MREPAAIVERSYQAMLAMDQDGLERVLWRGAMTLDGQTFLDGVIAPLLVRIGEGWAAGEVNPGQEHMGSDVVDRILTRMTDPSRPTEGASLVVATLPGERHRLGARLVSAAATVEGWRVTYLGDDLPVAEIVSAAERVAAAAVAISVVRREELETTTKDLLELRELLDPRVDLLVGGRGAEMLDADRLPKGVVVFQGLEGLREHQRVR
jgi:methanogenic corrinoid protein MtbC1